MITFKSESEETKLEITGSLQVWNSLLSVSSLESVIYSD